MAQTELEKLTSIVASCMSIVFSDALVNGKKSIELPFKHRVGHKSPHRRYLEDGVSVSFHGTPSDVRVSMTLQSFVAVLLKKYESDAEKNISQVSRQNKQVLS